MFKLGPELTKKEIDDIRENTELSFSYPSVFTDSNNDNILIYKDNKIICCAVIDVNSKFIYNLCTHPNYRKMGYANQLMDLIIEKYSNIDRNMALSLNVETNEKGIIPKKMYENLNWICEDPLTKCYRYSYFFFPQTGCCNQPTRSIKTEIFKYGNFLNDLNNKPISIINGIIKYIIKINNTINFNDISEINENISMNNYQNLLKYKDYSNRSCLFNHVVYVDDNTNFDKKLNNITKKYKSCLYFLIVFIYKNNFLLINKIGNELEYIVSKKLDKLIDIKNYF
jgi:hypothetical protein